MTRTQNSKLLERRRREIHAELLELGDLRPGSLVARFRKCGKANCHCATEVGGGHGPSWSLTRSVGGKTVTRIIPPDAVSLAQAQIAECRRLRKLTKELVEVSEGICEAKLTVPASREAAKKGASDKTSKKKLLRKSRT